MAKKKENKDYSTGNGKRWLIGFGVIALLAIVIVIIVVSIPPNVNAAMELLNKASINSFMMNENEKKSFDEFELKVKNCSQVNDYIKAMPTEMEDVQTLTITLSNVLEHYNDYIVFSNNNNAFKSNYKKIKNGLNNAMASQKELNSILNEVNKLTDQSPTYLQNAWIDFREEFVNWLEYYQESIDALRITYHEGMGKSLKNNLASKTILDTTSNYIEVLTNDFEELATEDKEKPNASSYKYTLTGKVKAFDKFVNSFIVDNTHIENYYFDNELRENYKKINDYFESYNEPDMKNAIASIIYPSNTPTVSKVYVGIEDTDNIYSTVKIFLVGGV